MYKVYKKHIQSQSIRRINKIRKKIIEKKNKSDDVLTFSAKFGTDMLNQSKQQAKLLLRRPPIIHLDQTS